jgi:protein-S-isoprenylcysteine O-methyltransferase Ste14
VNIVIIFGATLYLYSQYWQNTPTQYLLIFLTTVAFYMWGFAQYVIGDALNLMPHANKFVSSGVYKKIRHPIYVASTLIFICWTFYTNNIWIFLWTTCVLTLQITRAFFEEKAMYKKFGDAYTKYKKQTWF